MNSEYKKLIDEARKKQLNLTAKQYAQIKNIYKEVAKELKRRQSTLNKGSFTKKILKDYRKAIKEQLYQLNKIVYSLNKESIKTASEVAANVQIDFFNLINQQFAGEVSALFNAIPKHIMLEILNGNLYSDGKGLSSRIWNIYNSTNKNIEYIITKGLAEKKSIYEISQDVSTFVNPDAKKDFAWKKVYPGAGNKKVDYNAQRLVRTSINHANFISMERSAEKNPFVDSMHWGLSNSHYERQVAKYGHDICDEWAGSDEFGLGVGNYPVKGSDRFPHPQCLCHQYPVIEKSLDQISNELKSWMNGEGNKTLDKWYNQYGKEFAV